ncbi:MAG: pitrilysin family protein [Vicinamibacterales bacterium]|nr:pitrilysin family protein [Vicinamibacterales bacterium]
MTSRTPYLAYVALALMVGGLCVSVASTDIAAQALRWPSERPPRPLEARPVNFPPYEIRKLDNGMQVVLVSHHEQPAVSVRLLVRAGAAQDPKDKLGVAMLTASLLDQGTTTRSSEQIADQIDFVGGILGAGAGTDLSFVNAVVMKNDLPLALDLIADLVRRPAFAEDEVERQRAQALSGLTVAAEDPGAVAARIIDRLIYGFHPYGMPGTGTAASLAALTRQDVVDFHAAWFAPNNMVIAIVGDVTADEAFAGVRRVFADWAPREVPVFAPIEPPPPTRRVIVVDKPDAVQTSIRVGQLGIPRKHDDYVALDQAVRILGGEGANRVQRMLRSERGLTYGASADLNTYKFAGGIVAETETRTEATGEALRLMVDEFSRLQRERVWPAELEGAQAYMAGNFPLTIETPDAIATQVLNTVFYDLPVSELETYRERVTSVGPADIQRVSRSYLRPDRLAIVLVGNADSFVKDLRGIGFPEYERIPIGEIDLLAADLRRAGVPVPGGREPQAGGRSLADPRGGGRAPWLAGHLAPAAYGEGMGVQPEGDARARELLRRAIEAHGGLDALTAVKGFIADADTVLATPDGEMPATTRTYVEYPDHVRVDATIGDVQLSQVYAAGRGWLRDPGGVRDAPAEMLAEFKASVRRDLIALLAAAGAGTYDASLLPDEGFQGRVLRVVSLSADGQPPLRLFLDGATGRLVKLAYDVHAAGRTFTAEERYDDFRPVDGVVLPFKASVLRDGLVVVARTITNLQLNPTFGDGTFARPQ